MRLAWLSDIHLDHIKEDRLQLLYKEIKEAAPDYIFITGDISNGENVRNDLLNMRLYCDIPILFVMGNHDYYDVFVQDMRHVLTKKHRGIRKMPQIYWLGNNPIIFGTTIITGIDGWADTRYGDYKNSPVVLWDDKCIRDLHMSTVHDTFLTDNSIKARSNLAKIKKKWADKDAFFLKKHLTKIPAYIEKVIIATHVPPFVETSLYKGKVSDKDYLPFFASKATGDCLLEIAAMYKNIVFDVYCGHTHSKCVYTPPKAPNLTVHVAEAEYGNPIIQSIVSF